MMLATGPRAILKNGSNSTALVIVQDTLRCRLLHFKLCAHFLDLRCLLPETCGESFDSVLLLRVGRFLPLTGKRASRRRDFAESVQTQSRVRAPCFGLR